MLFSYRTDPVTPIPAKTPVKISHIVPGGTMCEIVLAAAVTSTNFRRIEPTPTQCINHVALGPTC